MADNKKNLDFFKFIPGPLGNVYNVLTEQQKDEFKKTTLGATNQVIREGIELSRMVTKPTDKDIASTEEFLEKLYTKAVGAQNVETVTRGDREITQIKEPESDALKAVRDITAFTGSMVGVGKVIKPLQALNVTQKVSKVAPKTATVAKTIFQGETAAQLSINPYEENLANILGELIDDDNQGMLGSLEEYMLEPMKSSNEKTELENRIALLGEGLALTGAFGAAAGAIKNSEVVTKPFIKTLKSIKEQGTEAAETFLNVVKRQRRQDKDYRAISTQKRQDAIVKGKSELFPNESYSMGDTAALKEGLTKKFSTVPWVRDVSNALAKTFTTRGGRSQLLHENYLQTKNLNEKYEATIEHIGRNLDVAIDDIFKAVGGNKEKVIDNVNKILFTDFRLPTIQTSKGISVGRGQEQTFKKELEKLPESARPALLRARKLQDTLSKLLLKQESVPAEDKKIIADQLGFYVRESYKLYEDKNYVPSSKHIKAARQFIKKDLKSKTPDIKDQQLRLEVQSEMEKLAGGKGQYTNFAKTFDSFQTIREGILESKQNIPQPIKNYLGEVKDPTEKLVYSMTKISKFVNDTNFHNQAFKDGKDIYFHDKNNIPGFNTQIKKIKGAKIQPYGDLSGKYTTPNLAQYYTKAYDEGTLVQGDGVVAQSWRALLALKSQTQKSATTRRYKTHIKNIVGSATISLANGFRMANPKELTKAFQAIKGQFTKNNDLENQAFLEELQGQGIMGKSAVINDLKNLGNEGSNIKYNPFNIKGGFSKIKKAPVFKHIVKADEKITDAYIAEDDFFKIGMYGVEQIHLNKFVKALPDDKTFDYWRMSDTQIKKEAGRMTRNGLPNYDIIPENIKALRAVPFMGRFFSFLSESMRLSVTIPTQGLKEVTLGNSLKKQGAKESGQILINRGIDRLAGYTTFAGAGGAGLAAGLNAMNGIKEDFIEDIKAFVPEYAQNDNLVISVNEDGVPIYHNVTPWDSFDYPRKIIQTSIHQYLEKDNLTEEEQEKLSSDLLMESLTPFFGESISQEAISNYVFRNGKDVNGNLMRNPYNKLERYNDEGTYLENLTNPKNFKIFSMNIVEALMPGSITDVYRDSKKLGKDVTDLDQIIYPQQQVIKMLTGFGGTPLNKEYLENIYGFKISDFKNKKSNRTKSIYSALNMSETTDEIFKDTWLGANREYYNNYKELHSISEHAENLNLDVLGILKDRGIARRDRFSFLSSSNRYFTPLVLTDEMRMQILNHPILSKNYLDLIFDINKTNNILSQLPVLLDPSKEEKLFDTEEVDEIFKDVRTPKSTGGLVEGKDDVPQTKEDPADRVNPITGLPYSDQMARLGFNEGKLVQDMLSFIGQARGYEDSSFLKQYADDVKWQEVRGAGPTTVQNNNGPAKGSYQVEGSQGSSRNETILQRAKNFYEEYPNAPKSKEIQYALEQQGKDLDFSTLSEQTQDSLFYMDAERGTLPLDKLATGELDNKTAWMEHWNQGPDRQVMEDKWNKAQKEKEILLQQQLEQ